MKHSHIYWVRKQLTNESLLSSRTKVPDAKAHSDDNWLLYRSTEAKHGGEQSQLTLQGTTLSVGSRHSTARIPSGVPSFIQRSAWSERQFATKVSYPASRRNDCEVIHSPLSTWGPNHRGPRRPFEDGIYQEYKLQETRKLCLPGICIREHKCCSIHQSENSEFLILENRW